MPFFDLSNSDTKPEEEAGWPDDFQKIAQDFRQKPQVLAQIAFGVEKLEGQQKLFIFITKFLQKFDFALKFS